MLLRNIKRNINIEVIVMLYLEKRLVDFVFGNKVMYLESFGFNIKVFKEFVSMNSFVIVMKEKIDSGKVNSK